MGAIQPWHIILVVLVFVILFGSKKLPDAARGLGRSLRIFKSEVSEMTSDGKADTDHSGADRSQAAGSPEAPRELPAAQTPAPDLGKSDNTKKSA